MLAENFQKLEEKKELSRDEIIALLQVTGGDGERLYELARSKRDKDFGKKVKLAGLIETSNYCRGSCGYCSMRKENEDIPRFRMSEEEITAVVEEILRKDYRTLFIQSGEDPKSVEILMRVLPKIQREDLEIIFCGGEFDEERYRALKEAGATGYVLKFETSDQELHESLRPHSTFDRRLDKINLLQRLGFQVGTGNIVGLPGQTIETLADDLLFLKSLNPYLISSSPFVPNKGSPLQDYSNEKAGRMTLKMVAMERLLTDAWIFANTALATEGTGQLAALEAGANVININFTPTKYRQHFTLYSPGRVVKEESDLLAAIDHAGLNRD